MTLAPWLSGTTSSANAENRPAPMTILYCSSDEIGFTGDIYTPIQFSRDKEIADELGLTDLQMERLKEADEQFNAGLKDWLASLRPQPDQKGLDPSDLNKEAGKLIQDSRKKVAEILKPDQLRRVRNVWLQLYGLWIISGQDLQELLRLSITQEKKIDQIRAQMFNKINSSIDQPVGSKISERCKSVVITNEKLRSIVRQGEQSALAVLTPQQKDTLEKIKGQPFKLNRDF